MHILSFTDLSLLPSCPDNRDCLSKAGYRSPRAGARQPPTGVWRPRFPTDSVGRRVGRGRGGARLENFA